MKIFTILALSSLIFITCVPSNANDKVVVVPLLGAAETNSNIYAGGYIYSSGTIAYSFGNTVTRNMSMKMRHRFQ